MSDTPPNVPEFLLRHEDRTPATGREGPLDMVTLVKAVDTSRQVGGIEGSVRLPDDLDDIAVGGVLVRRPGGQAGPDDERPWQAGRVYYAGVGWEEKTWPVEDFIAFRDHVAILLKVTVPGAGRRQHRYPKPHTGREGPVRRLLAPEGPGSSCWNGGILVDDSDPAAAESPHQEFRQAAAPTPSRGTS